MNCSYNLVNAKGVVMSEDKTMCGKQRPQNSKLGTLNHKTHDAKPKTLDPEPETQLLGRPNFPFVYSFEFRVLPQGKLGELPEARRGQSEPNFFLWSCVLGFDLREIGTIWPRRPN